MSSTTHPLLVAPAKALHQRERRSSKTGRRQHRSCDQCRQGKRACDAAIVEVTFPSADNQHLRSSLSDTSSDPALFWSLEDSLNGKHDAEMGGSTMPNVGACSNCVRTGKECTFEWLSAMHKDILPRRKKRKLDEDKESKRPAKAAMARKNEEKRSSPEFLPSPISSQDFSQHLRSPLMAYANDLFFPNAGDQSLDCPTSTPDDALLSSAANMHASHQVPAAFPDMHDLADGGMNNETTFFNDHHINRPPPNLFQEHSMSDPSVISTDERSPRRSRGQKKTPKRKQSLQSESSMNSDIYPHIYDSSHSLIPAKDRFPFPYGYASLADPSSDSPQQRLAASVTRSSMTDGLLRIYHDSMENALSCWLTERTCPYSANTFPLTLGFDPHESMLNEWGPNWSNRICARVCRLDRNSSGLRDRDLTRSEDRAASRVLHTVIIAFATQWSHSNRSRADEMTFLGDDNEFDHLSAASAASVLDDQGDHLFNDGDPGPSISVGFDRSIQETCWHQARRALQDTADIQSFRVIFAQLIFALTQKPLEIEQHIRAFKKRNRRASDSFSSSPWPTSDNLLPSPVPTQYSEASSGTCSANGHRTGSSEIEKITQLDGPPIFLETAIRQMFSYRRKLERLDLETARQQNKPCVSHKKESAEPLSVGDRRTFDLLFWLSIMFDTLSAAMNQRPLVVSDEDSDILQMPSWSLPKPGQDHQAETDSLFNGQHQNQTSTPDDAVSITREPDSTKLWGMFFMQTLRPRHGQSIARWPCSYEEAAATLSDAAPIKVLLFRKVTHLQTLVYRNKGPGQLEETIHDALRVYQYWNDTYGAFILDCVTNHDALPPRIQSWYVVLAGHWHLAGFLLADIIEAIDDSERGSPMQRSRRMTSNFVTELRQQNAFAVTDLGRSSCPQYESSFQRAHEFHFALSQGALLTEPWTDVLLRSFAKAGCVLLELLDGSDDCTCSPSSSSSTTSSCSSNSSSSSSTASASAPSANHSSSAQHIASSRAPENLREIRTRADFCIKALRHLGRKSDIAQLASVILATRLEECATSGRGSGGANEHMCHSAVAEGTGDLHGARNRPGGDVRMDGVGGMDCVNDEGRVDLKMHHHPHVDVGVGVGVDTADAFDRMHHLGGGVPVGVGGDLMGGDSMFF
ncbi:MAG: hypothetical protein M1819_001704 [Sarea resinae]|nr:MAG: hypothetical protein M1819_001704 [Sarea resinae]